MVIEEEKSPPPNDFTIKLDSRRSWSVCLASFVIYGICMGMINNFGVLFVSLLEEFQESKGKTAWVGSLQLIWFSLLSSCANSVAHSIGFRRAIILGAVLFSLGFLTSSFAHRIWVLYLTYGLLSGTGASLLYTSVLGIQPFVFKKDLATALGIVLTGNSLFTICLGPMNEFLLREYGMRTTLRLFTLWMVPLGLGCVTLPDQRQLAIHGESKNEKINLLSTWARLLKHKPFALLILAMCLLYVGIFIPLVHLISFSKDIGIATNVSVYSISCIFLFDALGKLFTGKVLDYFHLDVFKVNTLGILLMAVSITLLPLINNVYQLFLFAAASGFGMGTQGLCVLLVSPRVCRPEDHREATMFLFTIISIPGGVGPFLAAWMYDETQSYELAFFISGGLSALAACFSIFLSVIQETWTDKYATKEVVGLTEPSQPLVGKDTKIDEIGRETV